MIHGAGEHVGDRLDAAVGMPGKAGEIFIGIVVAEVVEQQKRIELRAMSTEGAAQMHAGPFERGL